MAAQAPLGVPCGPLNAQFPHVTLGLCVGLPPPPPPPPPPATGYTGTNWGWDHGSTVHPLPPGNITCALRCTSWYTPTGPPQVARCIVNGTGTNSTWSLPGDFSCVLDRDAVWPLLGIVTAVFLMCTLIVCVQERRASKTERQRNRRGWQYDAHGWVKANRRLRPSHATLTTLWGIAKLLFGTFMTFLSFSSARVQKAEFFTALHDFRAGWIGQTVAEYRDFPILVSFTFMVALFLANLVPPPLLSVTSDLYTVATDKRALANKADTSEAYQAHAHAMGAMAQSAMFEKGHSRPRLRNLPARMVAAVIHLLVVELVPLLVARYSASLLLSCFAPLVVFDYEDMQWYQIALCFVISAYSFLFVCVLFTGVWGWNQRDAHFTYCVILKAMFAGPISGVWKMLRGQRGDCSTPCVCLARFIVMIITVVALLIMFTIVPFVAGVCHFMVCLFGVLPGAWPLEVMVQCGCCECNLFNPGGLHRACGCFCGKNFLAGTHKHYYEKRGGYAGSFANAVPYGIGPFLYLVLKVVRQLMVAVPPGVRFPRKGDAESFNALIIFWHLVVPSALTVGVAATALALPAGFSWDTWVQARVADITGHNMAGEGILAVVCICCGASILFALSTCDACVDVCMHAPLEPADTSTALLSDDDRARSKHDGGRQRHMSIEADLEDKVFNNYAVVAAHNTRGYACEWPECA